MDTRNWMSLTQQIHGQKLRYICLPATHDSGTCSLGDQLVPGQPGYQALAALEKVKADLGNVPGIGKYLAEILEGIQDNVIASVKGLATATSRSIAQQLDDGIRNLDLRIYYDAEAQEFYTYHGLVGTALTDVLQEVQSFLAGTAGEIVYVTMGHFTGLGSADYAKFTDLVLEYLGDSAYLRVMNGGVITNDPFDQTYEQIVSQSGTARSMAILVSPGDFGPDEFWPGQYSPPDNDDENDVLYGMYTNTTNLREMLDTQQSQLQTAVNQDLPFALYMTLTPSNTDYGAVIVVNLAEGLANLLEDVLPASLHSLIDEIAGVVLKDFLAAFGLDDVPAVTWKTLQELSAPIDTGLVDLVENDVLKGQAGENPLSFIYLDFYEDSPAVEFAIQRSLAAAQPAG